nr:ATP dependent RNA helicase DDX52 [Hymenolepis microstoma]
MIFKGQNMLVGSPTGSGKTAAYLIPLLNIAAAEGVSDNSEANHAVRPYCIILTTSHELLGQVFTEAVKIGKNLFPQHGKIAMLRKDHYNNRKEPTANGKKVKKVREKRLPVDTRILITTPIRLTTLLKKKKEKCPIKLDSLRWLVIDECDKMLESDLSEHAETNLRAFRAQLNAVLTAIQNEKGSPSIALFSATLPEPVLAWAVEEISSKYCDASRGLVKIQLGDCNSAVSLVKQELRYCGTEEGKLLELRKMLIEGLVYPCLIFTESRTRAAELYREITLCDKQILVSVLSGDKSESQRIATVRAFREGKVNVLICTDLLGRGMDFKSLMMVVNYDLPPSPIEYIHRIGRTGRAGRAGGRAVTLWTDADLPHMDAILDVMSRSGVEIDPELRRLVGVWKARRASKTHAKALGGVVSQRKGERRLAAKVARAVSKSKGKAKLDKKLLRPWNPHRRSLTDVKGSKLNALKIALEAKASEQGHKKCIIKKKKK